MPENSDGPDGVKTTQIYLDEDGRVKMDDTLAPIYTEERFSYYRAPGLNYFDKVSLSSANYDLKEIWVMKDSCDDPASIDYEDWTMYVDVDICPVQFTNDPENAGQTGTVTDSSRPGGDVVPGSEGRMILIEDDTAYTDRDLTTPATQDQMDDPSTILYVNTRQKGINSPENYSGYGKGAPCQMTRGSFAVSMSYSIPRRYLSRISTASLMYSSQLFNGSPVSRPFRTRHSSDPFFARKASVSFSIMA